MLTTIHPQPRHRRGGGGHLPLSEAEGGDTRRHLHHRRQQEQKQKQDGGGGGGVNTEAPARKRLRLTLANDQAAERMYLCVEEDKEEEEEDGHGPMDFGEGTMAPRESLVLQRHWPELEQRRRQEASMTPPRLPNTTSAIARFNQSNAFGKVHPAAG